MTPEPVSASVSGPRRVTPPDAVPPRAAGPVEESVLRCEECGERLSPDEIFCGECGAVSQIAARHFSQSRDTVALARIEADSMPEVPSMPDAEPDQEISSGPDAESVPEAQPDQPRQRLMPAPFHESDDLEATRISRPRLGERFVLQFSTGESSTVHGNGLIGRNPISEPGEYFDQVVRVIDPSRSVSKTHLEFGQEAGTFWVMDRYSGNGTVVREPESDPIRCTPERRYRVARGTRVDIGEQFFVVS